LLAYPVNAGLLLLTGLGLCWLAIRRGLHWRSYAKLDPAPRVLLAWLLVWLIVFILPSQRSERYVIPAVPALAALMAEAYRTLLQPSLRARRLWALSIGLSVVLALGPVAWLSIHHPKSSIELATLLRAQHQTREFEDRFIQIGINYRIVGGFRFYERAEIRDAIAYLRIVNEPADDLAFERIVNVPKRGIGDKAVEKIHIIARAERAPLSAAAARLVGTDELTGKARKSLADLVVDIARWRDEATAMSPANLTRLILDESGYTAVLQAERSVEASGRLENLSELARAMEEYETLGEFLEHVSLVMDNDRGDTGASVTIMTIHAAKGLEYDNVFLVGWEEGIFPSQRALDEGGLASLEEERRLAYVAITRAKRKCTIIHAANRRIYGQWTSSIPSRFIEELPLDHIEAEQSMTGGASLWRANWSEQSDPFAHLAAANQGRSNARGPGWQRAATSGGFNPRPQRIAENTRSAVSLGNRGRSDLSIGLRVFHEKFGYGAIALIEGNKLEIDFEQAGRKRVMDSFVSIS
jgi:DNA helicase-2/ATP-dependent DNA helicase PcrA